MDEVNETASAELNREASRSALRCVDVVIMGHPDSNVKNIVTLVTKEMNIDVESAKLIDTPRTAPIAG